MNGLYINTSDDLFIKMHPFFDALGETADSYNWLVSEAGPWDAIFSKCSIITESFDGETYHFIEGSALRKAIADNRIQVMNWGMFCAFPKEKEIKDILDAGFPKADFNSELWTNPVRMQNELSVIEIAALEGTKIQIKSESEEVLAKISGCYKNAYDLEKYNESVMRKEAPKAKNATSSGAGFFSRLFGGK